MINFILGMIVGTIISLVAMSVRIQKTLEKLKDDLENNPSFFQKWVNTVTGEKAEIIEPTPPEVDAMEAVFEENKAKGRDTKLEEVS